MPRNGSGSFARNYDFTADSAAGPPDSTISSSKMDTELDDVASALTSSIAKDGQTTPTADLPMGGQKHTSVGAATARSNYVRVAELQDASHTWIAGGGTADAITATYAPAFTALTNGMLCAFRAASANATATPTFAPNGLTAKTIVKGANLALVANDIEGQHAEYFARYNSSLDKWILLNPKYADGVKLSGDALNGVTTDSTLGIATDYLVGIDVSESNATNKALVSDVFTNAFTTITAKAAPVLADTFPLGDSAASVAAKMATLQHIFDAFNALTAKMPIVGDKLVVADSAASGVAKNVTITALATLLAAAASDMETGTAATLFVTPSVAQRHPSACKAWVEFAIGGTTINASYNVPSITRAAGGDYTINFTTPFSSANYAVVGTVVCTTNVSRLVVPIAAGKGTTSCQINVIRASDDAKNEINISTVVVAFYGDQ